MLHRPTARARRRLWCAQLTGAALVVLAAVGVAAAAAPEHTRSIPVTAVLAEAAPALPLPGVVDAAVPTPTHWHDRQGTERSGLVWVDVGTGRVDSGGPSAGVAVLIPGWLVVGAAGVVARSRFDARDSAHWDAEWARVEPVWSGRVR